MIRTGYDQKDFDPQGWGENKIEKGVLKKQDPLTITSCEMKRV